MEEQLETRTTTNTAAAAAAAAQEPDMFIDDIDSNCSTPYVSAPSSPGRGQPFSGYYYSAPTSPMHFVLTRTATLSAAADERSQKPPSSSSAAAAATSSFEFDFSGRLTPDGSASPPGESMSSADELFLNGKIRPMKLSTHLQRPQMLAPLPDCDDENDDDDDDQDLYTNTDTHTNSRGREMKIRSKSLRRRTRSMSPLRNTSSFAWQDDDECEADNKMVLKTEKKHEETGCDSENAAASGSEASSSRSSSVGRSSKRWVFLKEFLYRSKSEGRNNGHKYFWGGLSFSPVKEKKMEKPQKLENLTTPRTKASSSGTSSAAKSEKKDEMKKRLVGNNNNKNNNGKPVNGIRGKRRVPPSAHELHYTANRAQAEEMRKKTFLPYRQGLLGCLGFSSKSYGAWNGFTRALNPVSSR